LSAVEAAVVEDITLVEVELVEFFLAQPLS
jgi:hypothetical protein